MAAGHPRLADNGAGRSARPSRPGGGAVHAEGGRGVLERATPSHVRAGKGEGGRVRTTFICLCAYEKELDRPVTEPLAELPGVRFGVEGRLLSMSTYMQKFPANPGVGRDIRLIGQPLAA